MLTKKQIRSLEVVLKEYEIRAKYGTSEVDFRIYDALYEVMRQIKKGNLVSMEDMDE